MTLEISGQRADLIKQRARNHWPSILQQLGVEESLLNRKGQPCPVCEAGKDRFQFTDKFGNGDYYCRHCGHGDGFKLLEAVHGWPFHKALLRVGDIIGSGADLSLAQKAPSSMYMQSLAQRIWDESQPVTAGDEVDRYLRGRALGLEKYPESLRFHPALGYYSKAPVAKNASLLGRYPAMIASLQARDGQPVSVHRTYLENGPKAGIAEPKKVLNSFSGGPAIRLFEATDELAVTEGIETGLAVHLSVGMPVWAAYSAGNLERVWIPPTVKNVRIYADNDASFTGQAAAFALAKRLKSEVAAFGPRTVQVFVPKKLNTDWADVWVAQCELLKAA